MARRYRLGEGILSKTFEKTKIYYPMKRSTTLSAIGGYQPFLFCVGMYFVALFFSIFICSAIFYAVNPKKNLAKENGTETNRTAMIQAPSQVLLSVAGK